MNPVPPVSSAFHSWLKDLGKRWYFWFAGILALCQISLHELRDVFFGWKFPANLTLTLLHGLQALAILALLCVLFKPGLARPGARQANGQLLSLNQKLFYQAWMNLWVVWFLFYALLAGTSFVLQSRIRLDFENISLADFKAYCKQELQLSPGELDLGMDLQVFTEEKGVIKLPSSGKNLVVLAQDEEGLHLRVFNAQGHLITDQVEREWAQKGKTVEMLKSLIQTQRPIAEIVDAGGGSSEIGDQILKLIAQLQMEGERESTAGRTDEPRGWTAAEQAWKVDGPSERLIRRVVSAYVSQDHATAGSVIGSKLHWFALLLRYKSWIENTLNNVQTLFLYWCYFVLTYPVMSIGVSGFPIRDRSPLSYAIVIVLLLAIFEFFGVLGSVSSQFLVFFNTISAICGGVIMSLLIARLESKKFGAPTLLIVAFFLYAVLQTGWALEQNPATSASLTHVLYGSYLILKLLLFFYVLWLMQSGLLLYYFHTTIDLARSTEREREDFLRGVEPATSSGTAERSHPADEAAGRRENGMRLALFMIRARTAHGRNPGRGHDHPPSKRHF